MPLLMVYHKRRMILLIWLAVVGTVDHDHTHIQDQEVVHALHLDLDIDAARVRQDGYSVFLYWFHLHWTNFRSFLIFRVAPIVIEVTVATEIAVAIELPLEMTKTYLETAMISALVWKLNQNQQPLKTKRML